MLRLPARRRWLRARWSYLLCHHGSRIYGVLFILGGILYYSYMFARPVTSYPHHVRIRTDLPAGPFAGENN